MQANLDVFVDGDNGYGAEPARVTHQLRERPLNFVAAVQGHIPGAGSEPPCAARDPTPVVR